MASELDLSCLWNVCYCLSAGWQAIMQNPLLKIQNGRHELFYPRAPPDCRAKPVTLRSDFEIFILVHPIIILVLLIFNTLFN